MPLRYPVYSIDSSALIYIKDELPQDVFPSVWHALDVLADNERIFVCQQVKDECHDIPLINWFNSHPNVIRSFDHVMNLYFNQFQIETSRIGLSLTNPSSLKHSADPFVVTLALLLEERDLGDLNIKPVPTPVCHVITHEKRGQVNIPIVCNHYSLRAFGIIDLFRTERISF